MTSSHDPSRDASDDASDDALARRGADQLAVAAEQLRAQPQHRAVEIADAVLRRSLAAPRPAVLVRCAPPHEHVAVSSTVLIEVLRATLDDGLAGAAVSRVLLDVDRREHLEGLTIELQVAYGEDILAIGDRARALADTALQATIGRDSSAADDVVVRLAHVHVSDVTRGDPHLVDAADEHDH